MSVRLQRDYQIDYFKRNKGKVNLSNTPAEDINVYFKGWMGYILQNANIILDRMSMKNKFYFLSKGRLPKEYQKTYFGEAYEKLDNMISKMLNFDYGASSFNDCVKYYEACEKYVDDVVAWLKSKEEKQTQPTEG